MIATAVTTRAYDAWDQEQIKLIKKTVAKDATNAELFHFLNLASRYDLDPFAGEIWLAKSSGANGAEGRLLLMVGRDGLRKIAHRSGLRIDSDVVRAKDTFRVSRVDGRRVIDHSYEGGADERGEILGAWCEVVTAEGDQAGYYFAAMAEFKPTNQNKLKYSPWGSQISVMIMAAAERQALRMATPLSGLLAEGEGELNQQLIEAGREEERVEVAWAEDVPESLRERIQIAVDIANDLDPNSYTPPQLQLLLSGREERELIAFVEGVEAENVERQRRAQAADAVDAEVVEDEGLTERDSADLRAQLESLDPAKDDEAELGIAIEDELKRRAAEDENQGHLL